MNAQVVGEQEDTQNTRWKGGAGSRRNQTSLLCVASCLCWWTGGEERNGWLQTHSSCPGGNSAEQGGMCVPHGPLGFYWIFSSPCHPYSFCLMCMCREWGWDRLWFTLKWCSPPCPAVWGSIFQGSLWIAVVDELEGSWVWVGGSTPELVWHTPPPPSQLGLSPDGWSFPKAFSSCLSLLCPSGKTMEEAGGGRMSLLQIKNPRQARLMLHTYIAHSRTLERAKQNSKDSN